MGAPTSHGNVFVSLTVSYVVLFIATFHITIYTTSIINYNQAMTIRIICRLMTFKLWIFLCCRQLYTHTLISSHLVRCHCKWSGCCLLFISIFCLSLYLYLYNFSLLHCLRVWYFFFIRPVILLCTYNFDVNFVLLLRCYFAYFKHIIFTLDWIYCS